MAGPACSKNTVIEFDEPLQEAVTVAGNQGCNLSGSTFFASRCQGFSVVNGARPAVAPKTFSVEPSGRRASSGRGPVANQTSNATRPTTANTPDILTRRPMADPSPTAAHSCPR